MAKATLCFTRIGNDGYKLAKREDGVWFIKEGFYSQSYGWTTTKWKALDVTDHPTVEAGLKAHANGDTSAIVGFGNLLVITDGKGLRLP